jgi:Family of unknown function (DUF5719)
VSRLRRSSRRSRLPAEPPPRHLAAPRGLPGHRAASPAPRGPRRTGRRLDRGHGTVARLPVIIVVAAAITGAGLADRNSRSASAAGGPLIRQMPAAAPASALSSTWFCGGASGSPAKLADGTLVVANATAQARHGTVTFIPSTGASITEPVDVGPFGRSQVVESGAGPAPFVGAIVDMDGGGVAVEQVVKGQQGLDTAPCATTGSDHSYFADGTTQENASLLLSLLNPYPDDAIVDLTFVTEQGAEAPADFQGIVVPAHSIMGVDVGTHLRRRARVATTVSARAGRVVAWKTQVINPTPAAPAGAAGAAGQAAPPAGVPRVPGLSLVLGAPSPGTGWWWPDGIAAPGLAERYQIYNPGSTEADVSLAILLDQGSAEPFRLKIAPHDTATVSPNTESRVPKGVAHAATLTSTNGVGVVAERTLDAGPPSPRSGQLDLLGARDSARRWVVAAGVANATVDEWVIVFNPGPLATTLSIVGLADGILADIKGLSGVTVPSGGRLAVRINDRVAKLDQGLLIEARDDIVVERDLYPVNAIGMAAAMGVPLAD